MWYLTLHHYLGYAIVAGFAMMMIWGVSLRLMRRDEASMAYWAAQHYLENALIAQALLGIVMLIIGRRLVGEPLVWLHYLYGSLFPLIAVVGGRIAGMRREEHDYVGLAWGSLFAFGLTLRALMTGLGWGT